MTAINCYLGKFGMSHRFDLPLIEMRDYFKVQNKLKALVVVAEAVAGSAVVVEAVRDHHHAMEHCNYYQQKQSVVITYR